MKKLVLILGGVLAFLFWKSCSPSHTLFSNDSPLGQYQATQSQEGGPTVWQCNNWLGDAGPPILGASAGLRLIGGQTHHAEWDEADILGAIQGLMCLAFPFLLIAAQIYRDKKGLGPL